MWLLYALLWASLRLFALKVYIRDNYLKEDEETAWGFGQWVPALLPVIPLLSIIEVCYGKSRL
jgi:hypothetical protein